MIPRHSLPLFSCIFLVALVLLFKSHEQRSQTILPTAVDAPAQAVSAEAPPAAPGAKTAASAITASAWKTESHPDLAAFAQWAERVVAAPISEQTRLVPEGMQLAAKRRVALARLIREAPERALAAAVPMVVRARLPVEVAPFLEERISGMGELSLNAALPAPGGSVALPVFREALIGGRDFRAFTYGRRAKVGTLPRVSILGIALDGALAVSESPLRVLERGEIADWRPVRAACAISGKTTPLGVDAPFNTDGAPTAVDVGGTIEVLCHTSHITHYETRLAAAETNAADGGAGSSTVAGRPAQSWTHGTKKVLIVRVDFSDKAGTPVNPADSQPITEDYVVNAFNTTNGIRDFYTQSSFAKTLLSIGATVAGDSPDVTAVLRMPATAASYATAGNNSLLHSDARAAATTAGFSVGSYDRVGVVFGDLGGIAGSQITYAGLGNIIGANFWVNGYFDFVTVTHEIGHNYGLNHANLWQVTDGNPVSASGTSQEYGDDFDVMGNADLVEAQFSHWNKSILQWIPDTAVTTITSGGTYRVFRFDAQGANLANALSLKIVRDRTRDYWIGHRRATANASLDNGAYILWGYNENQQGDLLDMTTPGASTSDAALAVGATFTDTAAGITIHPLARGGSGADEWLDVQVSFQPRIQWAKSETTVDEQVGSAVLTLTRTNNSAGAVSVHYATSPGTATSPADFTTSSGDVTWAAGDSAPKNVTIPIAADALVEGAQNFTVTLSAPSGGVIVDSVVTTVTIADAGAVDTTFTPSFINSTVNKMIVEPTGGIVIGGWFGQIASSTRGGIARLGADGVFDANFASLGGASGAVATDPNTRVNDLARQPDGKIVVVGNFTAMNGTARGHLARLSADGTLDTNFATGAGANDVVNAVLVQPDGKILIGGYFTTYNGTARRMLARLNEDGTLDAGFNPPTFGSGAGWRVESLALQPDGFALIGGSFYFSGSPFKASLCRVTTTGALDSAFSGVTDGAHLAGTPGSIRSVKKIAVQLDGKIVIAGTFTAFNNTARGGLARLTTTGVLDATIVPTSNGECTALLIQPDGKILIGGSFTTVNGTTANRLARLSSTGVLDAAFVAAGGPSASIQSFALQADGKIIFGGDFGSFQGQPGTRPLWRFFPGLPGLPGTVQFSADTFAGIEGASATLTATRTGGSSGALTVNYSTVSGSAAATDFTTTRGTLSWADADTAVKTITVPITADALPESTESFTVNLGAPLIGSALLGAAQQATVNVTTAFGTWQTSNFTPLEIADVNIAGDSADPDNDGIKNLVEFALNTPPKTPNTTSLPAQAIQNVGGTNYLTLTFLRRVPALDLVYSVKTNGSMTTAWQANAVQVGTAVNNGNGTETVTFRDSTSASATSRFLRLDVTRTP